MEIPRVLVAGLSGGGGKTLLSVGLQAAWRAQGLSVAPFKKGPDYIDAAWSATAAERPCRNLDLFLLTPDAIRRSFIDHARDADVAVIEANRGLYDGADARGSFSSAELAKILKVPVLLIVDCTKATRTVAASVLGCQLLDPEVPLAGVVLNRVSGCRHETVIREAVTEATGLPVVGALPRLDQPLFPERHLGLIPPDEHGGRRVAIRAAGELARRHLDLAAITAIARGAPELPASTLYSPPAPARAVAPGARPVRIGVFRDAAFQFYYPENLEALAREGAEVVAVSPLTDRVLPRVDALYIGGGFPETMAATLAENHWFRDDVRAAAEAGMPMYAECGGAVFLGTELDFHGRRYPMAGVLPAAFDFQERPRGHGYAILETVAENPFIPVGETLRGHEFHYTYLRASEEELSFAFAVRRGYGFDGARDGLMRKQVLASYTHVHALAAATWAPGLVRAALRFRSRTTAAAETAPTTAGAATAGVGGLE